MILSRAPAVLLPPPRLSPAPNSSVTRYSLVSQAAGYNKPKAAKLTERFLSSASAVAAPAGLATDDASIRQALPAITQQGCVWIIPLPQDRIPSGMISVATGTVKL